MRQPRPYRLPILRDRRVARRPTHLLTCLLTCLAIGLSTARSAAAQAPSIEEAIELHLAGRLEEALEAYRAIAAVEQESAPNIAAAAHTNMCLIWMNSGDYEQALAACEKGLEIRRRLNDRPRLAVTLNNLGLTLQNLGRFAESRARYRESLGINIELGELGGATRNLLNLSGVAIQAGDYAGALENLGEALRLADENSGAPWSASQRFFAYLNEGVVLERLGAYRDALESYRKALAEQGSVDEGSEALLKVNLGVVYRNLGDPHRAVALFEEAIESYRRLDNSSGLSNALLNVALARHLNLDQLEAAEAVYREALAISVESGDRPEEIQDLLYLGGLLLDQERWREAEELFQRSLAAAEESDAAEGVWASLAGLGELAARQGSLRDASQTLGRAIVEIEAARAELTAESHRSEFFRDKRTVYALAVQVLADLEVQEPGNGHANEAFHLVQRAKARELFDELDRRGRPYSHAELAPQLPSGVVIEYFVGERDLLRWELAGGELRMRNLGPAAPLLALVATAHRALAGGRSPAATELDELSRALLGGIEPSSPALYISSDGLLRYLPFELLRFESGPVLDLARVNYLPSASALPALEGDREQAVLIAAALANPILSADGGGSRPAALLAARFGLADLPAAEDELASLARWLDGPRTLLSGPDATEEAFREAATSGARVVHLATHTVMDERPGRGAAILLSPGESDDGVLYPHEIAALDMRVDLTVLAACRTALDETVGGSSIANLTGALLAAGSRGVIATLWEVGDRATATFMDQFYWQLGQGATPAEALQRTKQRLQRDPEWQAPHLWAAYVLVGGGGAIVERSNRGVWIAVALVVLAVVAALVSRSVRRKRQL